MDAVWHVTWMHPHSLQSGGKRLSLSGAAQQQSSSTGGELNRPLDAWLSSHVTGRTLNTSNRACGERNRTIAWPHGFHPVAHNAPPILLRAPRTSVHITRWSIKHNQPVSSSCVCRSVTAMFAPRC